MESTRSYTVLRQGLKVTSTKWGVLGILYLFTLLVTLPLAMTFRAAMTAIIGDYPAIDELFGQFVYTIFTDVTRVHSDAVKALTRSSSAVVIVASFVHAVLGMGLVRVMQTDGSVREFFSGIVSFGWRGIRILFVTGLFAVVLLAVAGTLSMVIVGGLTEGNVTEGAYVTAFSLAALLVGLAVTVIVLTAEYARITTVRNDSRSMFRSVWNAFLFVLRHPVRMVSVHGPVALVLALAIVGYWYLDALIGMTTMAGMLIMAVIQQGFVLLRLFTRMWNTANGVGLMVVLGTAQRSSVVHAPSVHDSGTLHRDRTFQVPSGPTAPERRETRSGEERHRSGRPGGRQHQKNRRRGRGGGTGRRDQGQPAGHKNSPSQSSGPSQQKKDGGRSRRRRPRRRRPPRSQGGTN